MARRKTYTKEHLLDVFMSYAEEEGLGFTLEQFCVDNSLKLDKCKELLTSVEEAEKDIWEALMTAALNTVTTDPQFEQFSTKDKLLSVYFTFFENCGLNEGFCQQSIRYNGKLKMLNVLKKMKAVFTSFTKDYFPNHQFPATQYSEKVNEIGNNIQSESLYGQLLFLIDFWSRDNSVDYEKTDIAIEKAVKALTDLMDITPVKSLLDFGKFIWQERFQNRT